MKLHPPFIISARLAPALCIEDANGKAYLSLDESGFVIDLPDGSEHLITDYHPGRGASIERMFGDILSFLGACAESRSYAESMRWNAMEGENSELFPENVGQWAQQMSDEIAMLQCEIEESTTPLIEA